VINKNEVVEDQLSDFTRDLRVVLLSLLAVVVGVISAFVAKALVWLIAVFTNLAFFQRFSSQLIPPGQNHLGYWVILIPAIGGLIIGFIARFGSEKIRGHGIPEALEAILFGRSRMEVKVAVLKPLSSAISIGTGGPFGAEGPIIMTGGAFGSLFAQMFHLSSVERKTLLVAGAAAGMSAIFATPVAAILLAIELLLFEWKPRSFIPVAVASAVASILRVPLLGAGPIFPVSPHPAMNGMELTVALCIGLIAGLGSGALTALVYFFEDLFLKIPIHWMWWPAIGGLFVGVTGFFDPRILGVGYETIHDLLRGNVIGIAAVTLLTLKALAWSFSLGSGTSGGVLAPLLIMGGALGAVVSPWISIGDAGMWSMISMAAMMGGTMRSPFTAMLFTLELTHDLNVLPGLLIGCVASHAVTVLMLRRSILTEKVARRGHHVMREYSVDPLMMIRVKEVMDQTTATVQASMKVSELSDRIAKADDPVLMQHQALWIVDDQNQLKGIITRGDILRFLQKNGVEDSTVLEAGNTKLIVAHPDELVYDAANKMLKNDIGRLPVVSRENPRQLIGYLGRHGIMQARLKMINEEHQREPGWLSRFSTDAQDDARFGI
jgi:chloride channel protein, CIC family